MIELKLTLDPSDPEACRKHLDQLSLMLYGQIGGPHTEKTPSESDDNVIDFPDKSPPPARQANPEKTDPPPAPEYIPDETLDSESQSAGVFTQDDINDDRVIDNDGFGDPPPPPADEEPPADEGPELDVENLPWDGRIHASSKARVKNGTWRMKRNVDPELVKRVREEYKDQIIPLDVGNAPPPPPATGDTPPPPAQDGPTWENLIALVTGAGIRNDFLLPATEAVGLEQFPQLRDHPDKLEAVYRTAELKQDIDLNELDDKTVNDVLGMFKLRNLPLLAGNPDEIANVRETLGL